MHVFNNFDSITTTVGEIVAHDIRTAEVFKRLGIDFCCNGKRPLDEACRQAGLPVSEVLEKLGHLSPAGERLPSEQFEDWSPAFLVDYVVNVHHRYLYQNLPFIEELARKAATKHGDRYPRLRDVYETFEALKTELLSHLQKEERVLFPAIKRLAAMSAIDPTGGPVGALQAPISRMELEHDDAGTLLFRLRDLTDGYVPPFDACNTHRLLLSKLAELEADLMQHIHLENNILFPKALKLKQVVETTF